MAGLVPPVDRNEIIFIDSNVENYSELLSGINTGAELVFLDRDQDGMQQIADVMSQRSDVDSVHIIAHSDSGQLQLGNALLTQESMQGEHADELSTIKSSLAENADIRIYGGEFGQGVEGKAALDTLSDSTDSDVFDSEDFDAFVDVDTSDQRREIIFVDISVSNYQELISGIDNPNSRVILIDGAQDGLEQIEQALQQQGRVDAIHLISHGNAGELYLGASKLDAASMQGMYADELATIKGLLSENADILIYGCNFGEGDEGAAAAALFADLTGADIAASTDATGHASLGGDWDLELQHGSIETGLAINADTQDNWQGKLEVFTLDFDNPDIAVPADGSSITYNVGGGTVQISYTGTQTNAGFGHPTSDPVLASGYTGGITPAQDALRFLTQNGGYGNPVTITIDFTGQPGGSADNVGFSLFDVDNSERLTVTGTTVGGGTLAPTNIATSAYNTITSTIGSVTQVDGTGPNASGTEPDGNVYVYFNTTEITSITLTYAETVNAYLALADITFIEGEVLEIDLDSSDLNETVDDDLDSIDYSGVSSGLIPWNGDWFETDGNDTGVDATTGNVQVVDAGGGDGEIRLNNAAGLHETSITRALDLSGYIGSELTFDYGTGGTPAAIDSVSFEISTNGGTNWTTLETFTGTLTPGSATVDIAGYESADNQIRFRVAGGASYNDPNDYFFVDNLKIVSSPSDYFNPVAYVEGDTTGIQISNVNALDNTGVIITDNDSTQMSAAKITIQNFQTGDELLFTNIGPLTGGGTIIGTYTAGVLDLDVVGGDQLATIAEMQAAIESILFRSTSDNPTVGDTQTNRTIAVAVYDDAAVAHVSNDAIATINILGINDAPTITLPGSDITAAQNVTESIDGTGFTIGDVDETSLGARMTLTVVSGTITVTAGTGITIVSGDGTNEVVVTGSIADLNNLLTGLSGGGAIDYDTTQNINDSLTVTVDDLGNSGTGGPLVATNTVAIIVNTLAPVLDLDDGNATRNSSNTFTEGGGAVSIVNTATEILDSNSSTLQSATITLTNVHPGDVLAVGTLPAGITATISGGGTVVTLTGIDTKDNYPG